MLREREKEERRVMPRSSFSPSEPLRAAVLCGGTKQHTNVWTYLPGSRCQGERAINIRRAAVNFNPRIACAAWYRQNDYERFYERRSLLREFLDTRFIPPKTSRIRRCTGCPGSYDLFDEPFDDRSVLSDFQRSTTFGLIISSATMRRSIPLSLPPSPTSSRDNRRVCIWMQIWRARNVYSRVDHRVFSPPSISYINVDEKTHWAWVLNLNSNFLPPYVGMREQLIPRLESKRTERPVLARHTSFVLSRRNVEWNCPLSVLWELGLRIKFEHCQPINASVSFIRCFSFIHFKAALLIQNFKSFSSI